MARATHNQEGNMLHIDDIDLTNLSSTERLQLAQALLDSVLYEARTETFTEEQMAELDRRSAEVEAGMASLEPWDAVRQRLLSGR
jgi:putative addiction module component (TIGR02574 family)